MSDAAQRRWQSAVTMLATGYGLHDRELREALINAEAEAIECMKAFRADIDEEQGTNHILFVVSDLFERFGLSNLARCLDEVGERDPLGPCPESLVTNVLFIEEIDCE